MNRLLHLASLCLLVLGISSAAGAQDIFEQYYGSGVHAYFAGNYERAEEIFNELVSAGSQDPRVYYFRGLTQMQTQGCMIEIGMADFEQAAQLEIGGQRFADVSKALSRIQGPTRIAIERIRAKAKFIAKSLQADALNMSGAAGLVPPQTPSTPNASPKSNDPFGGDPGLMEGEPKPMPTPSDAPTDLGSPFDSPSVPETTPPPPVPNMPAPDTSNPFGDDPAPAADAPAALDNPFGT